jgi:glycosyltransferase involved in cell wall biosynthesis
MPGLSTTRIVSVAEDHPLISVIIPTRNAAADIESCLDSLRAQSFQQFDVHVIDAASTDGTLEKVTACRGALGRELIVRSEPGSDVYAAMNSGVGHAVGEWVYFLGADDVIHDGAVFADVAARIAGTDADIVYGDVVFKSNGSRYGGEFSLDRLLFECNICHQSIFYRRSIFDRTGPFSSRYPVWADWELNIRCFRHPAIRTFWIDRLVAIYNDAAGVSRDEDPAFRFELPVMARRTLREQTSALEQQIAAIKSSRSYRIGRALFGWLD